MCMCLSCRCLCLCLMTIRPNMAIHLYECVVCVLAYVCACVRVSRPTWCVHSFTNHETKSSSLPKITTPRCNGCCRLQPSSTKSCDLRLVILQRLSTRLDLSVHPYPNPQPSSHKPQTPNPEELQTQNPEPGFPEVGWLVLFTQTPDPRS
jgi:hypothetical protein